MATNTILKAFTGSFRNRFQMMLELSEVYKREAFRRRDKLTELIKEQAERASKSELAAKMRVAKGFYTLEMAPPVQSGEMKVFYLLLVVLVWAFNPELAWPVDFFTRKQQPSLPEP
ncbi:uncharacterized protein isoform X2 [Choristoneura fumiferana]|uniref:uncharacterized protein isoform X2 n=1 Tax=Choristoneura fumiferana TaxID=7141 RepID=UPI003D1578E6